MHACWKTQFLCFGMKEDQRHLQHVNVMTRILIKTVSCKVSTVLSGTISQQSIQPEVVRAVEGTRGPLTSTSASSGGSQDLGCVRKHQAAGTRCGVPEHDYCTALLYSSILPWQLWQILLIDRKGISIIIFTLMASCDEKSGYPGTVLCSELALQLSPI